MPTLVAHHKVNDQKQQLASPKRKEFFQLISVINILQFKDAADAMAHDGVLPETVVVCIEA